MLKNRHPLVLYHYQTDKSEVVYHRIWTINRSIKDLRSPNARRDFVFHFLDEVASEPPPKFDSALPEHKCLVFEIGANEISNSVRTFRETSLPSSKLRVFQRTRDLLPTEPKMWVHLAAEVAHVICDQVSSHSKEMFIFWDGPAVVALMAGDAIGDYTDRKLRLMQWDPVKRTYFEAIRLPSVSLSQR